MDVRQPVALSAIVIDEHWEQALMDALDQIKDVSADIVFFFASSDFSDHYAEMLRRIRSTTHTPLLIGCSSRGIIGSDQELEDLPAVSLLALSLPDALFYPIHLTQDLVASCTSPQLWHKALNLEPAAVNGWLLFADGFHMDCERLIAGFSGAYPGLPMSGGLTSTEDENMTRTFLFLNDDVFDSGGVALGIGGPYSLLPLVSQGCEPIGETWMITKTLDDDLISEISGRPAYEMLLQTFEGLSPELQRRVQRNLLVGLAADEYQDSFTRGSFLIRQLIGVDRRTGSLSINAAPRVGQTIQFQMRDAASADLDLRELLSQAKAHLQDNQPIAGILSTCNGRGIGMFGIPDHDASAITRQFGQLPLSGLFCNGEIGPIGQKTFLHGFTASLALIVKT